MEFINDAAESFSDEQFKAYYQHRAAGLIERGGLSEAAEKRLQSLV